MVHGMQIQVCNHSSYPADDAGRSAVGVQTELRLDWATISPSGAGDPITGVAACLDGARLGDEQPVKFRPLPVRQLRVQARLRNRFDLAAGGAADHSLRNACAAAGRETALPVKLAITGPYTLSRLARIETTAYRDAGHLAEDLANHLADLVRDAVGAGARFVQVDEPALLRAPADVRAVRELLEPFQDAVEGRAILSVSTYGAPVGELFAQLNSLPGSVVALDCVSSPRSVEDLAATGSGKPLALGLIGTTGTPDAAAIASSVETATRRYVHDVLYLQPACGLDTLSPETARQALASLLEARALLTGCGRG
jgi:hypothetical protein